MDLITSSVNAAVDLQTYFVGKTLSVAKGNMVLDQFAWKVKLPSASSKTARFIKYEKFASPTGTPSQLAEGITPDARQLVISNNDVVTEQYGDLVKITDVAELTVKHPIVQKGLDVLGLYAAELSDLLILNVLKASTNERLVNGRAAVTDLVAADLPSYTEARIVAASLKNAKAMPFEGGYYVMVIPPNVEASLLGDTDFKAANQFNNTNRIYKGEIGQLAGLRFVMSNSPSLDGTAQATSGKTNKYYSSFAIGKEAYGIVDLQNMQVYNTPPGGQADPLHQRRQLGFKFMFKAAILNSDWLVEFISSGVDSANNA
jgi:N4-gp56 family major capsid protein